MSPGWDRSALTSILPFGPGETIPHGSDDRSSGSQTSPSSGMRVTNGRAPRRFGQPTSPLCAAPGAPRRSTPTRWTAPRHTDHRRPSDPPRSEGRGRRFGRGRRRSTVRIGARHRQRADGPRQVGDEGQARPADADRVGRGAEVPRRSRRHGATRASVGRARARRPRLGPGRPGRRPNRPARPTRRAGPPPARRDGPLAAASGSTAPGRDPTNGDAVDGVGRHDDETVGRQDRRRLVDRRRAGRDGPHDGARAITRPVPAGQVRTHPDIGQPDRDGHPGGSPRLMGRQLDDDEPPGASHRGAPRRTASTSSRPSGPATRALTGSQSATTDRQVLVSGDIGRDCSRRGRVRP